MYVISHCSCQCFHHAPKKSLSVFTFSLSVIRVTDIINGSYCHEISIQIKYCLWLHLGRPQHHLWYSVRRVVERGRVWIAKGSGWIIYRSETSHTKAEHCDKLPLNHLVRLIFKELTWNTCLLSENLWILFQSSLGQPITISCDDRYTSASAVTILIHRHHLWQYWYLGIKCENSNT